MWENCLRTTVELRWNTNIYKLQLPVAVRIKVYYRVWYKPQIVYYNIMFYISRPGVFLRLTQRAYYVCGQQDATTWSNMSLRDDDKTLVKTKMLNNKRM